MRTKKELNFDKASLLKGELSRELADRCPDRLVVFPSKPCTNIGCEYSIKQLGYMNCSFVAAEAGEHTLEAIGQMMGITREGVRVIELRAMRKIRLLLATPKDEETPIQKPDMAARASDVITLDQSHQRENKGNIVPAISSRKLGKLVG